MGQINVFFEEIAEIIFVLKSAGVGDVLDEHICVGKQLLCFLKSQLIYIFGRSKTRKGLEAP